MLCFHNKINADLVIILFHIVEANVLADQPLENLELQMQPLYSGDGGTTIGTRRNRDVADAT